jgi:hypothetical protein
MVRSGLCLGNRIWEPKDDSGPKELSPVREKNAFVCFDPERLPLFDFQELCGAEEHAYKMYE